MKVPPISTSRYSWCRPAVSIVLQTVALATLFAPAVSWADDERATGSDAAGRELREAAKVHYDARRYEKAATLYHAAFDVTRNPAYLFNAARAEQRAYQLDKAERDFNTYIRVAPSDSDGITRARLHLSEIHDARSAFAKQGKEGKPSDPPAEQEGKPSGAPSLPAEKKPAAPSTVMQPAPFPPRPANAEAGSGWRGPVGWAGVGLGVAGVAIGAWVLVDADLASTDLDKKLYAQGGPSLSYAAADAETRRINERLLLGWGVAGAGVVCVAAGTWLLLRGDDDRTVLAPTVAPGRIGFVLHFD